MIKISLQKEMLISILEFKMINSMQCFEIDTKKILEGFMNVIIIHERWVLKVHSMVVPFPQGHNVLC